MKSAYELAMDRLQKQSPTVKLTKDQKRQLAEVESEYKAKLADREIFLQGQTAKALAKGDYEALPQLEKQLASERTKFQAELEEKKQSIRTGKG